MKKYFTPAVLIISVIFGVLVYGVVAIFFGGDIALLEGSIATLALSLAFPTIFALGDRKYKKLMLDVPDPRLIEERVECIVNGKTSHGYMVMNSNSIYLLSIVDNKAVRCEIKKDQIKGISLTGDFYINIFTDYNKYIRIISGNSLEITKKLEMAGFGVRKEN